MENKFNIIFIAGAASKGADSLVFEGDLSIQHAVAIKNNILEKISESTALKIVVKHEARFDVSFLQLLLAIKAKFQRQGNTFDIEFNINDEAKALLHASGIDGLLHPNK